MKATIKRYIIKLTPTQFIIVGYLCAIAIATILLLLPISLKPGVHLSFIDTLFTATSGVTVTGLTVANTAETFSVFGTVVLIILFQLGGIGIMTLGTFLWMILGRNINLSYRKLIMIDHNRHQLSGLVKLMRMVLTMALIFEAVGAAIFGIYFYFAGYYDKWYEALYYGLFHAIASFTNAGFDLFGNSMLDFSRDYFVQVMTMALIILGAIGFPVIIEVREYLFGKNKMFRFSLYTKLTTLMFFSLIVIGTVGIWFIEKDLFYASLPWHDKFFYSLFNSISVRSGGFATMNISEYDSPTHFVLSTLMFIGASPSSVGGGIRTTTLAIILLTLVTYSLGKSEVRTFGRSIKQEDIMKSFVVFTAAILMVVTSTMIIDVLNKDITLTAIIFEVTSAFGTCGLSTGITSELSAGSKLIIMMLMLVGRVGMLSLLFIFRTKQRKESYHYPKEEVIIG